MTIPFLSQKQSQRQKYLLISLGIIAALAVVFFVGQNFFQSTFLIFREEQIILPPREIEIDLSVFDHPGFRELGAARDPIPFPTAAGNINPFLPFP